MNVMCAGLFLLLIVFYSIILLISSSLIFSVERNLRMMDLRGTISLSRVVNTADTLQQGEEPQLHHSSSKPIAGKYWRQTETKGTCAFAILKGEY